jgi:hypothetical protein
MALMIKDGLSEPQQPPRPARAGGSQMDMALALAGAGTALLIVFNLGGDLAAPLKLAACAALPGWALMRLVPSVEPAARLVWTLTASAVVFGTFAVVMAWTGFWYPRELAAFVLVPSAVSLLLVPASATKRAVAGRQGGSHAPERRMGGWLTWRSLIARRHDSGLRAWLVLSAAMVLWVAGLMLTSAGSLGQFGLLPALSPFWYVSLALVLGVCIWTVASRSTVSPWLTGSALTGLVTVLYGTAPLLMDVPRFPWVYKHMAVTALITETGHVDPLIDIYNRWPGFFAYSAFLGESMGYRTPISYAAWAEAGFALVDAVLVLAIARSLSRSRRIYWTAAMVFTLADWVNQNYYSPQSFSYSLYLALCLLALTFLRSAPGRWSQAVEGLAARLFAKGTIRQDEDSWIKRPVARQSLVIAAVVVIQAVIVFSHQLTPYMAVLGLLPLFLGGYFRPRWVGPTLLVLPLLYLIPNVDYVRDKYGLFSGFNFFANAGYRAPNSGTGPLLDILFTAPGMGRALATLLSVFVGILGVAGFVRQLRRGHVRTTLVVAWLALAPTLGLFGQAYGGEARFRVYLFALPWLAMGVAWLFWGGPIRTRRKTTAAVSALVVLTMLFTFVHLQTAGQYRVAKAEVAAGQWLDANTKPGDLILDTRYFFPLLQGPNYAHYLNWGTVTPLSDYAKEFADDINISSFQAYVRHLKGGQEVFVIISDEQNARAAREHRIEVPLMPKVEAMLAEGAGVESVFDNGTVRVYKYSVER